MPINPDEGGIRLIMTFLTLKCFSVLPCVRNGPVGWGRPVSHPVGRVARLRADMWGYGSSASKVPSGSYASRFAHASARPHPAHHEHTGPECDVCLLLLGVLPVSFEHAVAESIAHPQGLR
jgi:hypothetical protein